MRLKKEKKFVQLHEIVRIYVEHLLSFVETPREFIIANVHFITAYVHFY